MRYHARRVPAEAREIGATIEALAWLYALASLLFVLIVT